METVELVNSINKLAPDRGLVAEIKGENSIRIIDFTGETWATMFRSVFQPETWNCYTKYPNMLAGLLGKAVPAFGKSKTKWPNGLWPEAYLDVDIGYMIIEEAVTLTDGQRLEGWVVNPPEITAKRNADYDLIRQTIDMSGGFCFWNPSKPLISIIKKGQVKKIEVISNGNAD
jgi:hypothetical protein